MMVAGPLRWVALLSALVFTALAIVYVKYQARVLFTEIQRLEQELDRYEVEWGQLQLELTTLAEHNRIEQRGREELRLVLPDRDGIVYLKP